MAPEPFGYRALDALRMEKGNRYYSVDMTMLDTPDEAGLGAFVRLGKGDFLGREALRAARERVRLPVARRRLGTLLVGEDAAYRPVYGGEAVRLDGRVIGRLRSVAFGPTVERTIGYAYVPADLVAGAALTVDVFDHTVPAELAADVLVDPAGARLRG
jgi:glycine cleavage system aminomethyltransferase T